MVGSASQNEMNVQRNRWYRYRRQMKGELSSRRDRSPCPRLTLPFLMEHEYKSHVIWDAILPSSFFSSSLAAGSSAAAAPPPEAPPAAGAAAAPPPDPTFSKRSFTSLPSSAWRW